MHVTSAADAAPAQRRARTTARARLNHPAAAAVISLAGWLAFVLARWQVWAGGHITLFIMSGVVYSHAGQMSPRIAHVPLQGYDGQFYYRLALDPFNWHATAYGITMDQAYRYTRIGYPLVTWLLSAGQHRPVPTMLVLVNLACVAVIGWLGATFARQAGRHALWGLLFAGYAGLAISVGRDTSEPLADACMLGGLLACRRSRWVPATILIAYGVITNEPVLVLPVAIALTRLWAMWKRRARPGAEDLTWVVPGAAFVVLQALEKIVVSGRSGGASDISRNLTLPFRALVPGVYRDIVKMSWTHLGMYDINLIEFIALAVFVVAGFLVLGSTTAPARERVAFAGFVLVEMVLASGEFWNSVFNDGRTYIDAYLLALVVLIATPATAPSAAPHEAGEPASGRQRFLPADRMVTSRELRALAAIVIAVLIVVARRRILFE